MKWFIAISTCCKKSLNSRRPCVSLLAILGQFPSLFSKSVAMIAGRPKRDFSFFLASVYAILGASADHILELLNDFFRVSV